MSQVATNVIFLMLYLRHSERMGLLAQALSKTLADPLEDEFVEEWIAVPAAGVKRWLQLELARTLGASSKSANDGVVANIKFTYPGSLRTALLAADSDAPFENAEEDPWSVDRLTWAVLAAISESKDPLIKPLSKVANGASIYGRARYIADLFDHYANHRPAMMRAWMEAHDVDDRGASLADVMKWQPALWRATREIVGQNSAPERMPELIEKLRTGEVKPKLPQRLSLFGVTGLPGGELFLEMADALSVKRDVYLYLLEPSFTALDAVQKLSQGKPHGDRSDDTSLTVVTHPLLRSWSQPARERAVLLARATGESARYKSDSPTATNPATLLAQIQYDVRADTEPQNNFTLASTDRSIRIHGCHGKTRQVEVLHDALLHALSEDPTLSQDDILIVCPALNDYAALIEATFATLGEKVARESDGPRLTVQIADRSQREIYPVLNALGALIDLIGSRFSASAVTEFLGLDLVRNRFGLSDRDFSSLETWVDKTNVRWGRDVKARKQWNIPTSITTNTWRSGLDQLLLGVVVRSTELGLGPGEVAPCAGGGDAPETVGRIADAFERLSRLADFAGTGHSAREWCEELSQAATQFFTDPREREQNDLDWLRGELEKISTTAVVGHGDDAPESTTPLELADINQLLKPLLEGTTSRPDFYRGAITVSSLTPLQGVPFRVVAILGLDEGSLSKVTPRSDDISARTPQVGDRDSRADARQSLLEAVLSTRERLIITREGHDLRTNQKIPDAVVMAELRDTINSTLADAEQVNAWSHIEITHPRQKTSAVNFYPHQLGVERAWSFDLQAREGARARTNYQIGSTDDESRQAESEYLSAPIEADAADAATISLTDLREFLRHPVKWFFKQGLQVRLAYENEVPDDEFATTLGNLEKAIVGKRLLISSSNENAVDIWKRVERSKGTLPPGPYGDAAIVALEAEVKQFMTIIADAGIDPTSTDRQSIDLILPDGTRLVGAVDLGAEPGSLAVEFKRANAVQHLHAALDLMLLTALDPATDWRSVCLRRGEKKDLPPDLLELNVVSTTPAEREQQALEGLAVIVDCFRRATREPIPLFKLSQKMAAGERIDANKDWSDGFRGYQEGDDTVHKKVFADLEWSGIYALPVRGYDPDGLKYNPTSSRAEHYARYLWNAVNEFCAAKPSIAPVTLAKTRTKK